MAQRSGQSPPLPRSSSARKKRAPQAEEGSPADNAGSHAAGSLRRPGLDRVPTGESTENVSSAPPQARSPNCPHPRWLSAPLRARARRLEAHSCSLSALKRKDVFCSLPKPGDVGAMSKHNQKRGKDRSAQYGVRRMHHKPHHDRKGKRRNHRGQRNISGREKNANKKENDDQDRQRGDINKCAKKAGYRLAAAEIQKNGVTMAQHHRCRRECQTPRVAMRSQVSEPDRNQPFADIQYQHDQTCLAARRAMHVSSADIAASHRANVFAVCDAHKPVAEWEPAN